MDHYFKSPDLKTFFLGIVADFVTAPSEFPGLGVPSIHLETAFDKRIPTYPGTHSAQTAFTYILGGMGSLVGAVMGVVTGNGGQVLTGTTVRRILIENGRATGVELLDGRVEPADLVLASGGMKEVFFDLVGRQHLPEELIRQIESNRLMESVLMVQLGIDFDPTPCQPAALCYYYKTDDLEGAVRRLRFGDYHEGRDGFLIYVPSLHSPSLAPEGNSPSPSTPSRRTRSTKGTGPAAGRSWRTSWSRQPKRTSPVCARIPSRVSSSRRRIIASARTRFITRSAACPR